MNAEESRRSLEEIVRIGHETYLRLVVPKLGPEDHGKFVAVEIDSGDYEIDTDNYSAVTRLHARHSSGKILLQRAGYPTRYRMPRRR